MRIALLAIGVLVMAAACLAPGCGNTLVQDLSSPDGRRHLVVFMRDCGATTGSSTQVSILARSRAATDSGNVFIADTDHDKIPATRGGGPAVLAEWIDARTVRIRYQPGARIFKQDARHDDTDIRYVADADLASRP